MRKRSPPAVPTHANRLLAQQSDRDETGQPFSHSVVDTGDGDSGPLVRNTRFTRNMNELKMNMVV